MVKKHGHYCKVCGEYKSNESFSGSGHAAHICKKCAALPAAQRSEEMILQAVEFAVAVVHTAAGLAQRFAER